MHYITGAIAPPLVANSLQTTCWRVVIVLVGRHTHTHTPKHPARRRNRAKIAMASYNFSGVTQPPTVVRSTLWTAADARVA